MTIFIQTDSSANSSPKRTKRPISHVYETNTLPAINESTELQSLNNQPITPNQQRPNGAAPFDYYRVAQWNGSVPKSAMEGNPYKFDPKLMKKAEHLLGGGRSNKTLTTSLDNTDLTITSLSYIDEYQNTINGRNLQNLYVKAEPEKKWAPPASVCFLFWLLNLFLGPAWHHWSSSPVHRRHPTRSTTKAASDMTWRTTRSAIWLCRPTSSSMPARRISSRPPSTTGSPRPPPSSAWTTWRAGSASTAWTTPASVPTSPPTPARCRWSVIPVPRPGTKPWRTRTFRSCSRSCRSSRRPSGRSRMAATTSGENFNDALKACLLTFVLRQQRNWAAHRFVDDLRRRVGASAVGDAFIDSVVRRCRHFRRFMALGPSSHRDGRNGFN